MRLAGMFLLFPLWVDHRVKVYEDEYIERPESPVHSHVADVDMQQLHLVAISGVLTLDDEPTVGKKHPEEFGNTGPIEPAKLLNGAEGTESSAHDPLTVAIPFGLSVIRLERRIVDDRAY